MAMAICYTIDGSGYPRRITRTSRAPTVLVVDDEAIVLGLVRDILEDEGLRVHAAATGQEALDLAIREPPDLIITDLMMPGMSVRALRLQLQADPRTSHIPILLMTAGGHLRQDDTFAGYIAKPFEIAGFLDEVLGRVGA